MTFYEVEKNQLKICIILKVGEQKKLNIAVSYDKISKANDGLKTEEVPDIPKKDLIFSDLNIIN